MRISDWSSDVCSSDLQLDRIDVDMRRQRRDPPDGAGNVLGGHRVHVGIERVACRMVAAGSDQREFGLDHARQIGRAACRERVCPYVSISVVAVSLTKKEKTQHQRTLRVEKSTH